MLSRSSKVSASPDTRSDERLVPVFSPTHRPLNRFPGHTSAHISCLSHEHHTLHPLYLLQLPILTTFHDAQQCVAFSLLHAAPLCPTNPPPAASCSSKQRLCCLLHSRTTNVFVNFRPAYINRHGPLFAINYSIFTCYCQFVSPGMCRNVGVSRRFERT